jgi:hypothetical protein
VTAEVKKAVKTQAKDIGDGMGDEAMVEVKNAA